MNPVSSSQKPARRVRIIHLEDSTMDQELVALMLESSGISCDFVYAENGDTFRRAMECESADLIISDFSLPGYDGSRALAMARDIRSDLPFIFFSGTLGEEAAVESLKNGATDYVLKQRPERLVVAVRRALADSEQRTARRRMEEELRHRDELFRKVMENVEDMVGVVDLEGRLTFTSPSYRKLLGANAPAIGDSFLHQSHPDDRERILLAFRRTIAEGTSSRVEYRVMIP